MVVIQCGGINPHTWRLGEKPNVLATEWATQFADRWTNATRTLPRAARISLQSEIIKPKLELEENKPIDGLNQTTTVGLHHEMGSIAFL